MASKKLKTNGFDCPPNRYQVTSWLGFGVLASIFYSLLLPNLEQYLYPVLLTCHLLGAGFVFICGFICTYIDPSDLSVKHMRNPKKHPMKMTLVSFPMVCTECHTRVAALSRHCAICDRCTSNYDHHCFWLNNCIGKRNYYWFFVLITALELFSFTQMYAGIAVIVRVSQGDGSALLEVGSRQKYAVRDNGYCYFVTIIVQTVGSFLIGTGNGYLVLFHMYLGFRHLTTFEYVMDVRKKGSKVIPESQRLGNSSDFTNSPLPLVASEASKQLQLERSYDSSEAQDLADSIMQDDKRRISVSPLSLRTCSKAENLEQVMQGGEFKCEVSVTDVSRR